MDKELIFSYRRNTAHTDPGDAEHLPCCRGPSGLWWWWGLRPDPVVGKRVNRGDAVW